MHVYLLLIFVYIFFAVNRSYANFFYITWICFITPLTMNQVVPTTYLLALYELKFKICATLAVLFALTIFICIVFTYDIEDDSSIQSVFHTFFPCPPNYECRYVLTFFSSFFSDGEMQIKSLHFFILFFSSFSLFAVSSWIANHSWLWRIRKEIKRTATRFKEQGRIFCTLNAMLRPFV